MGLRGVGVRISPSPWAFFSFRECFMSKAGFVELNPDWSELCDCEKFWRLAIYVRCLHDDGHRGFWFFLFVDVFRFIWWFHRFIRRRDFIPEDCYCGSG